MKALIIKSRLKNLLDTIYFMSLDTRVIKTNPATPHLPKSTKPFNISIGTIRKNITLLQGSRVQKEVFISAIFFSFESTYT